MLPVDVVAGFDFMETAHLCRFLPIVAEETRSFTESVTGWLMDTRREISSDLK